MKKFQSQFWKRDESENDEIATKLFLGELYIAWAWSLTDSQPSLNSREDYVWKFRFFDDFFVQFGSEVFTANYNCHFIMPMHYNEHLGVI